MPRETTALVTGASSGIGAATTELLAGKGYRVVALSRGSPALDRLGARSGVFTCTAELTDPEAAARIRSEVRTMIGVPDLLVCNAGIGWEGPFESMEDEAAERVLGLNLLATVRLVREFLPDMRGRGGGHLVLVSSIAGSMGVPREAVYAASKAGVRVFGESLRLELAPAGIGVTVVHPGAVDTGFFDRRGTAYQRNRPRPIPAMRVAKALSRGARRGRSEVFVPGWLRLPARLQGAAPGVIGALRRRLSS